MLFRTLFKLAVQKWVLLYKYVFLKTFLQFWGFASRISFAPFLFWPLFNFILGVVFSLVSCVCIAVRYSSRASKIIHSLLILFILHQELTSEYDEKKSSYDNLAAGLESNMSKLEQVKQNITAISINQTGR